MAAKTSTKVRLGWISFDATGAFNKVGVTLASATVDIGGYMIPIPLGYRLKHNEKIELAVDMDLTLLQPTRKRPK